VPVLEQLEVLPRGEQQCQHQERRNRARLPELALPRLVDLADDQVVPNVFLDCVLERFHTFGDLESCGPSGLLDTAGLKTCATNAMRGNHATRSAARNFALRARGLRSTSSSSAWIGFFVSTRTACFSVRSIARNVCLTIRSSSE